MRIGLPPDDIVHHIDVSQTSDLLAEPPGFLAEPRQLRTLQHQREHGEGTSQSAQPHPQLVWPFRIVHLLHDDHVRSNLIEAFTEDVTRCLLGGLGWIEGDGFRFPRRQRRIDPPLSGEQIAASRFGDAGESQTPVGKQRMRNVEQVGTPAFDELNFRFPQLGRAPLGADLANVNRQLRAGALAKRQLAGSAFHHGLEDRLEGRAFHTANDLVPDRCVRNRLEAQPPSGSRALQLVNLRQATVQLGLGLDGLYPAPPNAAEPERSEEHTSELQSRPHLVCRLLLEKKKKKKMKKINYKKNKKNKKKII